jgi:hypothetical protein
MEYMQHTQRPGRAEIRRRVCPAGRGRRPFQRTLELNIIFQDIIT